MRTPPPRSALFMPGSNARALEKARTLPVDAVILDLEDAVAPDVKPDARARIVPTVQAGGFGDRAVFVRVNALDTEWAMEDLTAAIAASPDAIVLPKISSPKQIQAIGTRLLDMHAPLSIRIWAMLESPLAIYNAEAIAACAHDSETRLDGFILGTNDLAKETGVRQVAGRAPMLPWLSTCVLAARIHHIGILDSVYNAIGDTDGFAAECAQARDMGFDGKALIHPSQIEPCHRAFTPSDEEVAEARRIIAAFEQPENAGRGAIALDGRMVERMHVDIARRILAQAR